MKQRQLNLFADKKHFRALQEGVRKEVKEIMRRQKPKPEQLLITANESKISSSHGRKEPPCGVWQ